MYYFFFSKIGLYWTYTAFQKDNYFTICRCDLFNYSAPEPLSWPSKLFIFTYLLLLVLAVIPECKPHDDGGFNHPSVVSPGPGTQMVPRSPMDVRPFCVPGTVGGPIPPHSCLGGEGGGWGSRGS